MIYSKTGLALTESFESCRLEAYLDQHNIPTIGYGHTGFNVHLGQTCTQIQAEAWLACDIQEASNAVNRLVTVELTQGEFDALVDFTFNLGASRLQESTLLVEINKGDFAAAADQFERWDICDGKVVAGLLRRRIADKELFQS